MVNTEKFIFIANPKAGSISIERFILNHDDTAKKNYFLIGNKRISASGHISAREIKKRIGTHYDEFKKIVIVREPLSKLVSSYFFYKNGKPIMKGNKNPWPARVRVFIARLLPFHVWSMFYPYKSNYSMIMDDGELIVDEIIFFENLQNDLKRALKIVGAGYYDEKLPHLNKSKHSIDYSNYVRNDLQKFILKIKLKKDLQLYEMLKDRSRLI